MNNEKPPHPRPYKTWGRSRSIRLKGHDYVASHACLVTFCTANRRRLLRGALADRVQEHLVALAKRGPFRLWAWCIMPDHIHAVVAPPGDGAGVSDFVRLVKGRATASARKLGFPGRLWQRGFHDRVLRPSEKPEVMAAYIVGNPTRKGLIGEEEKWPWAYLDPDAL